MFYGKVVASCRGRINFTELISLNDLRMTGCKKLIEIQMFDELIPDRLTRVLGKTDQLLYYLSINS